MTRPRPGRGPRIEALLAALFAGILLAACGGSPDEPALPPPDEKKQEIAEARQELRQAKREAKRREAKAKRKAEANASTGTGRRADDFLATMPGQAGLAVGSTGGDGPTITAGGLRSGSAWSTIKVPIAQRVIEDAGGPGGLTAEQSSQITAALTLSDNDAAAALFNGLANRHGGIAGGSEAVGEMLREAGDTETAVSTQGRDGFSTYGQTEWGLAQQNRYMAALAGGCLADRATTDLLLDRMSNVTSDTWGIGSTGRPARWKGGWGPGTDGRYLARQMGVVETADGPLVIALAAIPDDGSFESAQSIAGQVAGWAVENLTGEAAARGC